MEGYEVHFSNKQPRSFEFLSKFTLKILENTPF